VNTISHTSTSHLLDKLTKLSTLISGQRVVAVPNDIVPPHTEGTAFCKNLLALKFVVSSYFECILIG
jgi:hypothetical protein